MEYSVQFPDPRKVDNEGLVAVGGELSTQYLLAAYTQGVFPWFNEEDPILWWSPNPRMVLFPEEFKVSKSLRQIIHSNKFYLKIDTNFDAVIDSCKQITRKGQGGTWITTEMRNAYSELHTLGYAHSFEIYRNDMLVGGLYGISMGKAFFGESMFFIEPNASKVALYYLVEQCKKQEFHFIDVQQSTSHLKSLGAKEIKRNDFLNILENALQHETRVGKWS
jgi:leucyl/phenylalanyl-tRNA---protein transferase